MNPKNIIVLYAFLFFSQVSFSQQNLTSNDGYKIVEATAKVYPKFYKTFYEIAKTENLFKKYGFIRGNAPEGSIAFAKSNGTIIIDVSFIENRITDYDDNRLVVVLYHELGHLYFFDSHSEWNKVESEKYAFEYSLRRTKILAEEGDCLPLKTGLKFMKLRSESNNTQDVHVQALKRIVAEQLFNSCKVYAENCVFDNTDNIRIVTNNGDSTFYDKSSPKIREQKSIYLYIVKPNLESPKLRLCIQYSESYPIYITDYLINDTKVENPVILTT